MKKVERKRLGRNAFAYTLLSLTAIYLSAGPTEASTVYTYTGNVFNAFIDQEPPVGSYTTSMSVSGSITLLNPLPANWNGDVGFETLNFSFFDGRNTITNLNNSGATLDFQTGPTGQIINWFIGVVTPGAISLGQQHFEIEIRTDSTGDFGIFSQCIFSSTGNCTTGNDWQINYDQGYQINGSPGHWSSASATPLPAALPLFATGLGALGLLGWRRKRKNAAIAAA